MVSLSRQRFSFHPPADTLPEMNMGFCALDAVARVALGAPLMLAEAPARCIKRIGAVSGAREPAVCFTGNESRDRYRFVRESVGHEGDKKRLKHGVLPASASTDHQV
jgi:hypothetical protein